MQLVAGVVVAAGLDWLEGLLPFLFVLIWIVSQVMNLFRGAANKPAAPPAANPRRPVPPPVPRRGAEPGQPLDVEIEEFLRRSLGRPPQQPSPPAVKPPAAQAVKPPRPRRPVTPPAEVVRPAAAAGQRAGNSGGDIADHVTGAFAHDLAHESPDRVAAVTPRAEPSASSDLVAAIRSPGGLRQLILMREVLERPTHRW
jgi:hypothetical protein